MRVRDYKGHPDYLKITEKELALHSAKNDDYAKGGDPLGNFKRVSDMLESWGYEMPPRDVAFIFMMKQLDAVGNMLGQDYEGKTEKMDNRLMDIAVYAKLMIILGKEKQNGK